MALKKNEHTNGGKNVESTSTHFNYFQHKKIGLATALFNSQKNISLISNLPEPKYTLQEFFDWLTNQSNFNSIYNKWVKSGFSKDFRPSIKLLRKKMPYSFDNIELITFKKNKDFIVKVSQALSQSAKNNLANATKRPVAQYTVNNKFVKRYQSAAEAARCTNLKLKGIQSAAGGHVKTYKGFKWKYLTPYKPTNKPK